MMNHPTIDYNYKIIKSGGYTELYIYHDRTMSRKDDSLKKLLDSWAEETKDVEVANEDEKKEVKIENEQIKNDLVLTDKEKELIKKIRKEKKKNKKNVRRSKIRLRRLINSNLGQYQELDKFLTLTCPNLKDRDEATRLFKIFIQRMRRRYGKEFAYIAVMEIQDGSRLEDKTKATNDIHFHTLLFNLPYIPKKTLQEIWSNGIIDIRKIRDYKDPAGYLVNYLVDDDILNLHRKRTYFPSKNLIRPIEFLSTDFKDVLELCDKLKREIVFTDTFEAEYVGKVTYVKFKNREIERSIINEK